MIIEVDNTGRRQILRRVLSWNDVREMQNRIPVSNDEERTDSVVLSFSALSALMDIPAQHIRCVAIFAPDLYHVLIEEQMLSMLDDARIVVHATHPDTNADLPPVRCVEFRRHHEMHTVSAPHRIRLEIAPEPAMFGTLHFHFPDATLFSSIIAGLSGPPAMNVRTLLGGFSAAADSCSLLSNDGLLRTCYPMIFSPDTNLVMNAGGTWDLIGENVPRGMKIRNIFCLRIRDHFLFLHTPRLEEELLWQTKLLEPALQAAQPMLPRRLTIRFRQDAPAAITMPLPPDITSGMLSRLVFESGTEGITRDQVDIEFA
jgi:hypothetical protein